MEWGVRYFGLLEVVKETTGSMVENPFIKFSAEGEGAAEPPAKPVFAPVGGNDMISGSRPSPSLQPPQNASQPLLEAFEDDEVEDDDEWDDEDEYYEEEEPALPPNWPLFIIITVIAIAGIIGSILFVNLNSSADEIVPTTLSQQWQPL